MSIDHKPIKNFTGCDTPSPCCVNLRCKSIYYRSDERPGLLHDEEAMGYWCMNTHEPLGPDKLLASHSKCQSGRPCFEAGPTGISEGAGEGIA